MNIRIADASGRTGSRFVDRGQHVKNAPMILATIDYIISRNAQANRPPNAASLPAPPRPASSIEFGIDLPDQA
jgi:hypothetical protein